MRLLLCEDERSLSKAIVTILEKSNYSVDAVYDGEEALEYASTGNYDGIILDLMMPKLDGMSVLKAIREKGDFTPVLILSAKSEIENKVEGLDAGANDYLTKPFEVRELLARIRAMTRSVGEQVDSTLSFGNVKLDCTNYTLRTETGSTSLANKEFQIMEMLMRHPSHLISTESSWSASGATIARPKSTLFGYIFLTCAKSLLTSARISALWLIEAQAIHWKNKRIIV